RSAKARNRGRSGTQRCGHGYGGLVIWTVAKRGVRGLCEGRYWGCVGARRGNSAVKRGEKAAAVVVERGDRACVGVAGGWPRGKGGGVGVRQWERDHDVSMRLGGGGGAGHEVGCIPGVKVSMIIIRPPQRGQGQGN